MRMYDLIEKKKRGGARAKERPPIARERLTDPETSAQEPMADPLELRMRREGHDM